jgi:8-oxo-dGTP diphosphatase
VPLVLVRHAWAGSRDDWAGDDRNRPLDGRGREQAEHLVELVSDLRVERILTSPYVRCVQTVEPLAAARGLGLELCDELGEERQYVDGFAFVRDLAAADAVVCGHGGLDSVVPAAPKWKKGAVFVLDDELRLVEQRRA